MVQDLRAARKAYSTPSFEILGPVAAKARLATVEAFQDSNAGEMLSVIEKQLEKPTSTGQSATLSLSPQ